MGVKVRTIFKSLFLVFVFVFLVLPSFAQDASDLVRVGITDNNFQNVLRQDVTLYATSDASICDKHTRKLLMNVPADTDIKIKNTNF